MTKAQAKRACREYVEGATGLRPDQRSTVSYFITHRWKPLHEGQWRDSTRRTNEELLKIITDRFGTTALEEVDLVEMQSWLNALAKKRSGSVVKHLRIFLRSILAEAVEQDFIRKNTARLLRIPKLRPIKKSFLSTTEITALMKATKWQLRDRALLMLIIATALRPSELFALRWKSFNSDMTMLTLTETVYRGELRPFTKTTEENATEFVTLYVPPFIADVMAEWLHTTKYNAPHDFVFANSEGGFITKENYTRRVLSPLADLAEIKRFNFQMLRRSVATHLQSKGSPKDIAAILRHRKTDTQNHYVQAIDASVREATENLARALLG
ncbi:MAG: tyrosine-type recombinase/integrase [Terriglobales bacterium]